MDMQTNDKDDRQFPSSILPRDWDQPSAGNEKLCRLFMMNTYRGGNPDIPYRFYIPKGNDPVPLVVYLHGADAIGRDNDLQLSMHDIGTMFARDDWQKKHPCFILAPQCTNRMHWSMPQVRDALQRLIECFVTANPRIDRRRIYLYGYSAGAVGLLEMLKEYPDYYAAAISICGATGPRHIEEISSTPLWLIHAADDRIVKASYGDGTNVLSHYMGSRNIYESMHDKSDGELKYTEFPDGTMKEKYGVNPHCSWVAVSDPVNGQFGEWLFVHTNRRCSEKKGLKS